MKDNLNIEKLFKDKLENLEGDVNPNLWNNISQGISTNVAASTGIGLGVKALIVSASVVAIGVTTYFIGGFNDNNSIIAQQNIDAVNKTVVPLENKTKKVNTVIIAQDNDPVINENKTEIITELSNQTVIYNSENNKNTIVENQTNTKTSNEVESILKDNQIDTEDNTIVEKVNLAENVTLNNTIEKESNIVFPTGKLEFVIANNMYEFSFNSNAHNQTKINWNFGDGRFSKDGNPIHIYSEPGEYKVTLTLISKDNELYEESKIIVIKTSASIDNIPNVITPNGDRINDHFVIKSTDIETFTIVINDLFGAKIFESNDVNFAWDGTDMSGNVVEKAVYTYYILATGYDGTVLKIPGQIYVR